jgi:VWFA-related protein
MKILAVSSALLLAAWMPAFSASPPPAAPSFGEVVEVNVVDVDIYVTDRNGNRVTGLKKGDFAVFEDGKAVDVSNFAELSAGAAPAVRETPSAAPPAAGAVAADVKTPPAADPDRQLSLVVFVDNLHLRPETRARAVEQIRKFLAQSTRPGDRVLLATYDNSLRVRHAFTDNRAALDATLHEIESLPAYGQQEESSRRTAYRAVLDLDSIEKCSPDIIKPVEGYAEQMRGEGLRTIGALTVMINSLSGVPGHKALLLVSDGISITPGEELFQAANEICTGSSSGTHVSTGEIVPLAERFSGNGSGGGLKYQANQAALDAQKYSLVKPFETLASHASANRVTLYTLQASGLRNFAAAGADSDPDERAFQSGIIEQIQTSNLKGSLTALAVDTGGRAMLDVNDFLPELAKMQEDFESYYSLGYTPTHSGDGKDHRIEVKVKRQGLRVRYRQSYRDKPALEKMADRTLAALFHGIEDNPLAVEIEIGDPAPADGGQYAVPVRLKIPLFKLAILNREASFQGKLRLLVATRDAAGGTSTVRQVEVPLNIPRKEVLSALGQYYLYTLTLKMKPGSQQVAVAVRDELAASTSYLTRPVTVGAATVVSNH